MSVTEICRIQVAIPESLIGWTRRYALAEILGTAGALLSALVAASLDASGVVVAIAAAWGETVGFYLPMFMQEFIAQCRKRKRRQALWRTLHNLLIEFGAAELLDTCLMRPALIAAAIRFIPQLLVGVLVTKLVADVVFYALAMVGRQISNQLEGVTP